MDLNFFVHQVVLADDGPLYPKIKQLHWNVDFILDLILFHRSSTQRDLRGLTPPEYWSLPNIGWILLKVVQITVLQAPYAPRFDNMINRHYISYKKDDVKDTE